MNNLWRAIQYRHVMSICTGLDTDLCSHPHLSGIELYADINEWSDCSGILN